MNDDKLVITSLNLYEFSMANNKEMGVLVDRNDPTDTQLFEDAFKEVDYILQTSIGFDLNAPKQEFTKQADHKPIKEKAISQPTNKQSGYCIRTGVEIPFDVEKPMCKEAYKSWGKYGDPDYREKFCHFSGEASNGDTSMSKPILKKNWKKAKEIFGIGDLPF